MAYITKGDLWDLLGDEALTFAGFLLTPEGAAVKFMLENTSGITLDSILIQEQLLPMLLNAGVITQAVVGRVNAEIVKQTPITPEPLPPIKKYLITGITENINLWLIENAVGSNLCIEQANNDYLVSLNGIITSPNATEVI